ncbi:MAG: hypothetical protein II126_01890 [Erysipelotrichaceae bacterium]|nr:hypothetical protein [Erysipelotrichaceae bacterium]
MTTDVPWVIRFINRRIVLEGMEADELNDHGRSLVEVREAIRRNTREQKFPDGYLFREFERKELIDPVGVRFSQLGDNWQQEYLIYENPWGKREIEGYHCYGLLPDGRKYGAMLFPYRSMDDYPTLIRIVDQNGNSRLNTLAGSYKGAERHYPSALVCSPNGNSLIWMFEGKIFVWNREEDDFISGEAFCLSDRLGNPVIHDAIMCKDGILQLFLEDGSLIGYRCDTDEILLP